MEKNQKSNGLYSSIQTKYLEYIDWWKEPEEEE